MSEDPRTRMLAGAVDLMSRGGLPAASMRDLARHSGTPLGSTYHYFPGGKRQLALEAVRFADDQLRSWLGRSLEQGPVAGLREFLAVWRQILIDSDFEAGCPVLSVAVTEPRAEEAVSATRDAFVHWCELLSGSLREHGTPADTAEALALLIVTSVEGSIAMCRVEGSPRALDVIARTLEELTENALAQCTLTRTLDS
ncbi:TetR/AcrR family transcriptional regulator [Arthrobacter sp. ISL-65]|uniref:TetR/AcrR family transcriptional regulator n=1 Tax=Arthrobacter sp. ISL-65 TaxID=2819112 RepID=UPI001BE714F9|nr:helix-turn-helix domain-containing protein [Arthrobacter sp. ISL-65]MBT2547461.1 TetR/AcrR family transcriptional regulator [Arthrobacter sp. ISL-65]